MSPQQGSGHASPKDEGRLRWAILALLFFCRISLGFQFQTMGSAASGITAEIGLSLTEIGTLIGLFMLPGVFLSIPSGYAARYMSDKGLLVLGLLVMGLGGATAAVAAGFGMLALARILCGIGFVIGTIYFAKMVQDWFAGKELATAMSILVVSWPLGIAIGQVAHDWLMTQFHWRLPFAIAGAYCITAALALWLGYCAPPGIAAPHGAAAPMGLPRRELWLTLLASSVWAFFNAGYLVFLSFAPQALQDSGFAAHQAIPMVSAASALMMISIPLSGIIADRTGRPDAVLYLCSAVAVACLVALPYAPFAILACVLFGLIGMGPAGVIMALTGQAMSPARRAFGMGVFSTTYYAITAPAPALAGWLVDRSGKPQDALILAAALFGLTMAGNLAFRVAVKRLR